MMIPVMTVMRMMKVAAAPLPQDVEINTRKKRERRKRKKKKRRRKKRESVNHLNLMRSQSLTDSSELLAGSLIPPVNCKERSEERKKPAERALSNSERTDGRIEQPTLAVLSAPSSAAARKERTALNNPQPTISLYRKTRAEGHLSWSA